MDETKVKQDNLSILIAARERIADPEHWCQGSLARDVDGEMCGYGEKVAVRWCASGSVWKEATLAGIIDKKIVHDENHTAVYCSMAFSHLSVAAQLVGNGRHTAEVNDDLGHGFVLEMYDKAIGCLKADLKQRGDLMKKALDLLRCAQEKISDPKRWCKNAFAVMTLVDTDESDDWCDPCSPRAERWCSMGILNHVAGIPLAKNRDSSFLDLVEERESQCQQLVQAFKFLERGAGLLNTERREEFMRPMEINDSWGHEGVLLMYREAIGIAEREGG